jgi:hypothetical protein
MYKERLCSNFGRFTELLNEHLIILHITTALLNYRPRKENIHHKAIYSLINLASIANFQVGKRSTAKILVKFMSVFSNDKKFL